jgi:hypothetical protein
MLQFVLYAKPLGRDDSAERKEIAVSDSSEKLVAWVESSRVEEYIGTLPNSTEKAMKYYAEGSELENYDLVEKSGFIMPVDIEKSIELKKQEIEILQTKTKEQIAALKQIN